MAALAVAMGIGRFAFTPILPMMQAELGVSVAAGGWLASANYAGYLLGAVSTMAMRISATTAIRAGLALIGGVTVGMALTSSFAVWIGLRALAGVASAWVLVFASSWCLEKLAPLGRPVLPSAVFAGVGVGIAIAGGACVLLMEQQASPAAAWGLLGIFALIVTALTWPVFGGALGPSREPRSATPVRTWNADRVRLVLCYGTFGFGYIIPATFIPVMARQVIRDPLVFGWAWPVFGVAAAASTFAVALLARRVSNRQLWSLSHLLMAIGVVLPLAWSGIAGITWAAVLVGGTFMVATMTGMQEARLVGGTQARVLMAAMTSAFATGQIVGPLAVSYLALAGGGFFQALLAACGLLLVSAGTLAWSSRRPDATP